MIREAIVLQAFMLPLFFCTQNADADLAVNFTNSDAPRQVLAGETTGVIPVTGWTNLNVVTASQSEDPDTRIDVIGSADNVSGTTIDISWRAAVLQGSNSARGFSGSNGTDGTQALYEFGLRDNSGDDFSDTQFTISDLASYLTSQSASSYDLYVYFKSTVNVSQDAISLGLGLDALSTYDPAPAPSPISQPFVLGGNADSNYAVFSGLTSDSTTVFFSRAANGRDGLIAGFQVVVTSIPEPSSTMLVSSLLVFLGLRRQRKR